MSSPQIEDRNKEVDELYDLYKARMESKTEEILRLFDHDKDLQFVLLALAEVESKESFISRTKGLDPRDYDALKTLLRQTEDEHQEWLQQFAAKIMATKPTTQARLR